MSAVRGSRLDASRPEVIALGMPAVRPFTENDIPAALALWAVAPGVEIAEGDESAQIAAYLRRNPGCSFVLAEGDRLLGAVMGGHDGRRGYLYHLAVVTEAQGRGYGRALVRSALAAIEAQGVVRCLILVARDNPGGRAFWIHEGWAALDGAEAMGLDLPAR